MYVFCDVSKINQFLKNPEMWKNQKLRLEKAVVRDYACEPGLAKVGFRF